MAVNAQKKETVCSYIEAESLKSVFKFLGEKEIETLCSYLEIKDFSADTTVMTEGEPGDFIGFLVKGKLAVKKETRFPGKHILLAILDPGTMVGELSIMECCQRNATVTALEESQLLLLSRERMNALIEAHPILGVSFLKRIIQILSLRLKKADDRLANLL